MTCCGLETVSETLDFMDNKLSNGWMVSGGGLVATSCPDVSCLLLPIFSGGGDLASGDPELLKSKGTAVALLLLSSAMLLLQVVATIVCFLVCCALFSRKKGAEILMI